MSALPPPPPALLGKALPAETPTLCPALDGTPRQGGEGLGPTLGVGISKRLKVMAEELLLLRGLGQGAIRYARHLRPGQLLCGSWAIWGEAKRIGRREHSTP